MQARRWFVSFVIIATFVLASASMAVAYKPTTNVDKQLARVKAFEEISTLRRNGKPADFAAIEQVYKKVLQPTVKNRDKEFSTEMDAFITGAIGGGKAGQSPRLAGQIVEKTLKRTFYLNVLHEIRSAEANFADKSARNSGAHHKWDEAWAYYTAVQGTAKSRDPMLDEIILTALDNGQQAIQKNDLTEMLVQGQIIDKTIIKVFYLSVVHEVRVLVHGAAKGPAKQKEWQVEGAVYYTAIEGKMGRNPTGAKLVKAQLSGDVNAVQPVVINREMIKAFLATARHEIVATFANWGKPKAIITAWETGVYSAVFEKDMHERMGLAFTNKLKKQIGDFIRATKGKNLGQAGKVGEEIIEQLVAYERAL